ncbi:MAG TPA: UDP-N-acetylmuramoyl-L-alanine--D-glutamate ligase [Chloroflexota bacterium]|nr:UDP-N-acetylmuramoyl-L-alanine--D-glutamate ligase [Chloroflexota bacterium]
MTDRARAHGTADHGFAARLSAAAVARLGELRTERIGIVGLGREGVDLVEFLAPRAREVVVSDRAPAERLQEALTALRGFDVRFSLGQQTAEDLVDCDEIFVSPGVAQSEPVVARARAVGARVSSATRLFFELCPGPIIGITGSSGKTTTTTMVGSILAAGDIPSVVGGNIGTPMLRRLPDITEQTWCVLELSSFQLADVSQSPRIAAILNITPNHLDRHADMEDYVRAKANIIRHQLPVDTAILNADDPIVRSLAHASATVDFRMTGPASGAWYDGSILWLASPPGGDGHFVPLLNRAEINLRGDHNVANALAAACIAQAAGCGVEPIRRALRAFEPVAHRLEVVATVDGVTYVNDSIATSPERSMAALRSFDAPVVLIAGGRDKHTPMEDWAQLISRRARAVVLVGEAAPLIDRALRAAGSSVPVTIARSFSEVVRLATRAAEPGDVVLLSPGCTSFDEFRDYEARGEAFRASVASLASSSPPRARRPRVSRVGPC